MALVYFAVWIVLNGRADADVLLTGALVSLIVYLFTWKVVGLTPKREWRTVKRLPKYISFVCLLVGEIVKANLQTARMILRFDLEPEPVLTHVHTDLKEEASRVLLANAVTLTPGTITAGLEDGEMTVHALDKSYTEGLENSVFEQRLRGIEEEDA